MQSETGERKERAIFKNIEFQSQRLSPPVCGLARRPETLFSVTLIVLLLGDLLHLIQQLADAQLQLGQLVFRRDLSVIVRMLANLVRKPVTQ